MSTREDMSTSWTPGYSYSSYIAADVNNTFTLKQIFGGIYRGGAQNPPPPLKKTLTDDVCLPLRCSHRSRLEKVQSHSKSIEQLSFSSGFTGRLLLSSLSPGECPCVQ